MIMILVDLAVLEEEVPRELAAGHRRQGADDTAAAGDVLPEHQPAAAGVAWFTQSGSTQLAPLEQESPTPTPEI